MDQLACCHAAVGCAAVPLLHACHAWPGCRDLARAARACREFAGYVREQRSSLRTVTVPEGVSYAAVR